MFHPPQRGLPRLAIRDFLPLQPFGLSASGGAATSAARRDFSPKAAPVCRTTNSDSCTTSPTYKAAAELNVAKRTITRWLTLSLAPPSLKIGNRRYFRQAAIIPWLTKKETTRGTRRGR